MAETGFEIYGKFYPAVESFNTLDPPLIRDLTGLDFVDFSEMYDELVASMDGSETEAMVDPVLLTGLVGVAVWRANPTWRRDNVYRFMQGLSYDAIKMVGDEIEAADDGPPAETPPEGNPSGGTPADSNSSEAETANQNGSGDPTLLTGAASE